MRLHYLTWYYITWSYIIYHVVLYCIYIHIYSDKFWANTHTHKHTLQTNKQKSTVMYRTCRPSIRTVYTHMSDKWYIVEHLTNPYPQYSIVHSQSFKSTVFSIEVPNKKGFINTTGVTQRGKPQHQRSINRWQILCYVSAANFHH